MDRNASRMRLWMRTNRDGVLTPDEETALHDFFEALRGIDRRLGRRVADGLKLSCARLLEAPDGGSG